LPTNRPNGISSQPAKGSIPWRVIAL